MTKALPFTQAGIRRAVEGARKAGLRVTAIKPDGTIVVNDGVGKSEELAPGEPARSKWQDVEA